MARRGLQVAPKSKGGVAPSALDLLSGKMPMGKRPMDKGKPKKSGKAC